MGLYFYRIKNKIKKSLLNTEAFTNNTKKINYLDFFELVEVLQEEDFLAVEVVFFVEDLLQEDLLHLQLEICSTAIAQKYSS